MMIGLTRTRHLGSVSKRIPPNIAQIGFPTQDTREMSEKHNKKRHVSPHVEIYAFPPAAISSIVNRITGVAMSGVLTAVSLNEMINGNTIEMTHEIVTNEYWKYCKPVMVWPVVYHFFGGIRHAVWDHFPKTVTNSYAEGSSYIIFASSVIGSCAICWY